MYKFLKQCTALMFINITIVLADPVDPTIGSTNNSDEFECLPPEQWKFPKGYPEVRAINSGSESGTKPLSELAQPLPKLTKKEEIIKDVLIYYPKIAQMVLLLNDPESRQEFLPRQLLLVGQAGVSKTTIATVLAYALKRKVIYFQGASLVGDQFQNSGVKRIEDTLGQVLSEIQKTDEKYIVIVDEFMRIVEDFDKDRGEGKKMATLVWYYLDRFKESGKVFFVGTANSIKELPRQVKSRFDSDILKIDVPNAIYRKKILTNIISNRHNLSKEEFESLIGKTEGFTHRKIEKIVVSAIKFAMERDNKNPKIKLNDFQQAVKNLKDQDYKSWDEQAKEFFNENYTVIAGGSMLVGGISQIGEKSWSILKKLIDKNPKMILEVLSNGETIIRYENLNRLGSGILRGMQMAANR